MNTEVLDCFSSGFPALVGQTLKQKYCLTKFLAWGEYGYIFEVEGGMVVKLSLDTTNIAAEIKVAKTL